MNKGFWLGKHRSQETKMKISKSLKGLIPWIKGRHHTKETRKKISEKGKGRKLSEETKEKMSRARKGNKYRLGSKHTEEWRIKMSQIHRGKRNPNYQGGKTLLNEKIRKLVESKLWKEAVFNRDNYTCQKCIVRGGKLCSHHIFNFSTYLDLRFAIDNGITLCKECHKKFHNKYGYTNNTKEQLEEFLNL